MSVLITQDKSAFNDLLNDIFILKKKKGKVKLHTHTYQGKCRQSQ